MLLNEPFFHAGATPGPRSFRPSRLSLVAGRHAPDSGSFGAPAYIRRFCQESCRTPQRPDLSLFHSPPLFPPYSHPLPPPIKPPALPNPALPLISHHHPPALPPRSLSRLRASRDD